MEALNRSNSIHEWMSFIENISPKEIELSLDRVLQVYKNLNIKQNFSVVMIAGTNGKGSTCAFLESLYHYSEYKVACYSSPHFFTFNERIRINKIPCSDEVIVDALFKINEARNNIPLTFFEMTTLAAILIFANEDIDLAIMEIGLGGRLDAVNILNPDVSLITSISLDHQEFLGNSLDKIFREKSGIFRPNKNAVINFKSDEEFLNKFRINSSAIVSELETDYKIVETNSGIEFIGQKISFLNLPKPSLNGKKQLQNLSGALHVAELLIKKYPLTEEVLKKAIKQTNITGRLQIIKNKPLIILDVAHNEESAESLNQFFKEKRQEGKVRCVFSLLRDKNIIDITKQFIDYVDEWYISELNTNRACKAKEIISKLTEQRENIIIKLFKTTQEAFLAAYINSTVDDNIMAFGSFFIVSEILEDTSICQIQKTQ